VVCAPARTAALRQPSINRARHRVWRQREILSVNNSSSKKYLRKKRVADRYGVVERTVDRWVELNRLPKPVYLPGSRIPLFAEDELDEHDRRATARLREPLAAPAAA
jgi:predicted DNA-binding transcriptional regulator AlpA